MHSMQAARWERTLSCSRSLNLAPNSSGSRSPPPSICATWTTEELIQFGATMFWLTLLQLFTSVNKKEKKRIVNITDVERWYIFSSDWISQGYGIKKNLTSVSWKEYYGIHQSCKTEFIPGSYHGCLWFRSPSSWDVILLDTNESMEALMVIIANGHGNPSSNLRWSCLHFS